MRSRGSEIEALLDVNLKAQFESELLLWVFNVSVRGECVRFWVCHIVSVCWGVVIWGVVILARCGVVYENICVYVSSRKPLFALSSPHVLTYHSTK